MTRPTDRPRAQAACTADWVNPDWWFSGSPPERDIAAALCTGCPLARQCLALALAAEGTVAPRYRFGIYAGSTPGQRWLIATGVTDWPTWPADPLVDPAAAQVSPDALVRTAP